MSSISRITDDEMRYYQFKARQQYLIKKEDHEWNEFVKKNKCSCCSCQPLSIPVLQKDVGIQAIPKSAIKFNQNASVKRLSEQPLSKSLNDMKADLEKLKLVVADIKHNSRKEEEEIIGNIGVEKKISRSESALNLLNEQRQNLIRTSLLNSLQRLHLSAAKQMTKPISNPRNRSFILDPNLEKQRLISRNAYLSSLINKPKVIGKTKVKPLDNNVKKTKENNKKYSRNTQSKTKKNKIAPTVKVKEEKTLIQSEASTDKDENIEKVVDGIIEDLLGEEILSLNRIKCMKFEKQNSNLGMEKTKIPAKFMVAAKKDIHLSEPSPETRAKIKKIPFFNLTERNSENLSCVKNSTLNHSVDLDNSDKATNHPRDLNSVFHKNVTFDIHPTFDEVKTDISKPVSSKSFRTLHTDQNMAQRVTRHRKLYFQYLERTSLSRSYNFDPIALANMVAESLLNDCISDICEELDDVPASLIADLYKQEFTSVL